MSLNPKHRARWIADMITEVQRFLARGAGDAEKAHVQRALECLQDGRSAALNSKEEE
jgi:hypothetical protein